MRDLQHRLSALGHATTGDDDATFGPATQAAVSEFQERRGLPTTGRCDKTTWDALVEAGWVLGDRPLYLTAPMLRGDDVASLQRRLGALGFDAGRIDGIFGPDTDRALAEFQRNVGLVTDSICGPATVAALARLGERVEATISDVRERERFRCAPRTLAGRMVAVAHGGGLDALATSAARSIRATGAAAVVLQHPDGSALAAEANALGVDAFVALVMPADATVVTTAFYRSPNGWESAAGRLLAELLHDQLAGVLPTSSQAAPMSLPVLRETRMPAVVIDVPAVSAVVERTADIAAALQQALHRWISLVGTDAS